MNVSDKLCWLPILTEFIQLSIRRLAKNIACYIGLYMYIQFRTCLAAWLELRKLKKSKFCFKIQYRIRSADTLICHFSELFYVFSSFTMHSIKIMVSGQITLFTACLVVCSVKCEFTNSVIHNRLDRKLGALSANSDIQMLMQ